MPYTKVMETGPTFGRTNYSIYQNGVAGVPLSGITNGYRRITKGNRVQNYWKRLKRGDLLPHTEFWQLSTSGRQTEGLYHYTVISVGQTYEAKPLIPVDYADHFQITEGDCGACVNLLGDTGERMVQAAASSIYSQGFDGLTFLAEFKSLRQMFFGLWKRVTKLVGEMDVDDLVNAWLEYRYGWRPLLADIKNFDEALREFDVKRRRYSERAGLTVEDSYTNFTGTKTSPAAWDLYYESKVEFSASVRGFVTADISPPRFRFNPVTTAWELVTLSFVIDWFWSVGSALEALSFYTIQEKYSASMGYNLDITKEFHQYHTAWKSNHTGNGLNQKVTTTGVLQQRIPSSVPFKPFLQFRLDALKVIDLMGIIWQRK